MVRGLPAILAEYERSLAEMVMDSPSDVSAVVARVMRTSPRSWLRSGRISNGRGALSSTTGAKWRGAVLTATKVDVGTLIRVGDMYACRSRPRFERNAALIRNVSDQARQRISDSVFRGFQRRAPAREIAKIRGAVEMGGGGAEYCGPPNIGSYCAQLNIERAGEAGLNHYEWVHSGKAHPRQETLKRNRKAVPNMVNQKETSQALQSCGCTAKSSSFAFRRTLILLENLRLDGAVTPRRA